MNGADVIQHERHTIDRAAWKRFSTSNRERCLVCGHAADVIVSLTAVERKPKGSGPGGGPMLAKQTFRLCSEHGQLRYGDALAKLQGSK